MRRPRSCSVLRVVVALERRVRPPVRRTIRLKTLPPSRGIMLIRDAAGRLLGGARRVVDRHFLRAADVRQEVAGVAGAAPTLAVDRPSIITRWSLPLLPCIGIDPPVVLMMLVPPTSWLFEVHARESASRLVNCVRPVGMPSAPRWSSTRCCDRVLHVDDRRLAGDRDRLFDRRRPSARRSPWPRTIRLSSMPSRLTRAEAGQRERHGVGAGPQVARSGTGRCRR